MHATIREKKVAVVFLTHEIDTRKKLIGIVLLFSNFWGKVVTGALLKTSGEGDSGCKRIYGLKELMIPMNV